MRVGETLTSFDNPAKSPLPGYKRAKSFVFCGLYLQEGEYPALREALQKLSLNDSAFEFEPERSLSLGPGFRGGFLGLLHLEIVKERLEREYALKLLVTAPTVSYQVTKIDGTTLTVRSSLELPPSKEVKRMEEPYVEAIILSPPAYLGAIFDLCENCQGNFKGMQYLSASRVQIKYNLPLRQILLHFYDQLKSRTKGYASFDYEFFGYKEASLVKLDILLAGKSVDVLAQVVTREKAYNQARELVQRLKKLIPRQLFEVPIQAAIGGKVIARETVKPLRKEVTAKLYGGDVTRKRKLLEKQKAGKKRLKKIGKVEVPLEAFLTLFFFPTPPKGGGL